MKCRAILVVTALLIMVFWVPVGHAADPTCKEMREMLVGRNFVAKEPLYDTKVDNHGIVNLERDEEEIPVGAEFSVLKVGCERNKLEVKIREVAEKKKDAVQVNFKLSKAERQRADAMDQLQIMLNYVWDEAPKE